jgi:4-amino-4-deoxy-L-arabinose transferase-like glycosyltransferase
MLAKGPVAAALPALAFFGYLAYYRELSRIRSFMIPLGIVIVAAMVAPWYVALYQHNGWEPIRSFFVGENVERFTTSLGTSGRGPFFYLPVVFTDGLPWSLLLPVAAVAWFRERAEGKASSNTEHRIRTLLLIWVAVIVVFFSLSSTKQDLYILPIIAAVAALGADVLARGAIDAAGKWRGAVRGTLLVTGLVVASAGALVLYVFDHAGAAYELEGTMVLGMIGILGGLITVYFSGRGATDGAAIALAASLVAVNWTLAVRVLPAFERYKPSVPLSRMILERAQPGDRVIHYEVAMPSMVFYLARRVDAAFSREEFLAAARSGPPIFGVMPEDRYLDLKADLGPAHCVLERQPTFDAKLREMLARRPPQAIVLISTRCSK